MMAMFCRYRDNVHFLSLPRLSFMSVMQSYSQYVCLIPRNLASLRYNSI